MRRKAPLKESSSLSVTALYLLKAGYFCFAARVGSIVPPILTSSETRGELNGTEEIKLYPRPVKTAM
jgi:hypothetical protein